MKTKKLEGVGGPHHDTTVAYIPAVSKAKAMAIFLHGRGATALSMLELTSFIEIPEHVLILAPEAAELAWYPHDISALRSKNEPHVKSSLDVIDRCREFGAQQNIAVENTILVGFSQGACVITEYLRTRAGTKLTGAAILSGGLLGSKQEISSVSNNTNKPLDGSLVYIGSDNNDPYIDLSRLKKTSIVLEEMGAQVQLETFNDLGHGVNQEEIDAIQQLFMNTDYSIN